MAAAAYNAGEGKVNRAMARYKSDNFWDLRKKRYLRSETKNYVPKIMALAILGKNLQSFGFDGIEFNGPIDYTEIEVPGNTDLVVLAQEMNIDAEVIYSLNPELRRWYTPPYIQTYRLKIPIEAEDVTPGGIVLPETAKEKPQEGTVIAVGPGKVLDSGERGQPEVEVGNRVLYTKYGGHEIKHNAAELTILRESDILAVLD